MDLDLDCCDHSRSHHCLHYMKVARQFESSSHQQTGLLYMLECGLELDGLFSAVPWELYLGRHFLRRALEIRIIRFVCFATSVGIFGIQENTKEYF